jgi:hypothetical protein
LTPPRLAPRLQSLPPILHKQFPESKQSYSKGARGLFVFLRLRSIFTSNSTSLSPWLRQWGSRYAIRAGRNLPDKEFRLDFLHSNHFINLLSSLVGTTVWYLLLSIAFTIDVKNTSPSCMSPCSWDYIFNLFGCDLLVYEKMPIKLFGV